MENGDIARASFHATPERDPSLRCRGLRVLPPSQGTKRRPRASPYRSSSSPLFIGEEDAHDCEAIVALDTNGLDRSPAQGCIPSYHFEETPDSLNIRVVALRINHAAITDHVIHDDNASRPRQPERPLEVGRDVFLVRV